MVFCCLLLKLLISGSVDGFDVDDLRAHTNYTGGYHEVRSSGFSSTSLHSLWVKYDWAITNSYL